jgi:hypothetical protein
MFVVDGDKKKLRGVVSMHDLVREDAGRDIVHDTLKAISA